MLLNPQIPQGLISSISSTKHPSISLNRIPHALITIPRIPVIILSLPHQSLNPNHIKHLLYLCAGSHFFLFYVLLCSLLHYLNPLNPIIPGTLAPYHPHILMFSAGLTSCCLLYTSSLATGRRWLSPPPRARVLVSHSNVDNINLRTSITDIMIDVQIRCWLSVNCSFVGKGV